MLLMPRRVKHRKQHRGRRKGVAMRGNEIAFGQFGLQAQGVCWMDSKQIEAARRVITRDVRRGGKLWIRMFPDKPVTAKPAETRLGTGRGEAALWVGVDLHGRTSWTHAGDGQERELE